MKVDSSNFPEILIRVPSNIDIGLVGFGQEIGKAKKILFFDTDIHFLFLRIN